MDRSISLFIHLTDAASGGRTVKISSSGFSHICTASINSAELQYGIFWLSDSGSATNCACHAAGFLRACGLTVMIRSYAVTQSLFGHRCVNCGAPSPAARSSKCPPSVPAPSAWLLTPEPRLRLPPGPSRGRIHSPRTPRHVPAPAAVGAWSQCGR
jgi:hypothetical protein